jgi:hypothetical protein
MELRQAHAVDAARQFTTDGLGRHLLIATESAARHSRVPSACLRARRQEALARA